MISRRKLLQSAATLLASAGLVRAEAVAAKVPHGHGYTPVETPNGSTLPWTMEGGIKVFHLVAEPVKREFAPGLTVDCWGYNGQTPGPTIEAVEGDRVRILVTNRLPEATSVHWHGFILPNGMDGVGGLTQKHIQPGETYAYEFPLRQHGTLMYHPHTDEMTQIALGMAGFFIIHPREPIGPPVDRDFAIFLAEWDIKPGTYRPNVLQMTDFNYFTFNAKSYPATAPLVVRQGQRVRIRLGNLSMDSHPIHIHGHLFRITGTPGGRIADAGQMLDATVNVPVGTTRDVEFVADNPGDWPLHCHKSHHAMNGMAHDLPNLIGVDQTKAGDQIDKVLPGYMPMGSTGMVEMDGMDMGKPKNTLNMGWAPGPFGYIEMGGMFTVVKIRPGITNYSDPGWYHQPPGTSARPVGMRVAPVTQLYTCPMHPEVVSPKPGKCPKCGMTLVPKP